MHVHGCYVGLNFTKFFGSFMITSVETPEAVCIDFQECF